MGTLSMRPMLALAGMLLFPLCLPATDEFFDDDLEERIARVNEGTLRFLPGPPEKAVHHHQNRITITRQSLEDGWVRLEQCHYHLDPVNRIDIVYKRAGIRALAVTHSHNIGHASVNGNIVMLSDVTRGGEICMRAESKALYPLPGDRYVLKNGPFMRRFLDGFYPMQITVEVDFPETMKLQEITPAKSTGAEIRAGSSSASLHGWFEGKLYTRFHFCLRSC